VAYQNLKLFYDALELLALILLQFLLISGIDNMQDTTTMDALSSKLQHPFRVVAFC